MATGVQYGTKEELLAALTRRVAYNQEQKSSSENIQGGMKDIVETIWDMIGGGGSSPVNGLSEYATGTIGLGGTLDQDTLIEGSFGVAFGSFPSPLTYFNVFSNGMLLNGGLSGDVTMTTLGGIATLSSASGSSVFSASGSQLSIDSTGAAIYDDGRVVTPTGIEYAGDYSATFAPNSLVTKAFVESLIDGIGAINGLTEYNPGIIGLGGTITEATTSIDSATGAENLFLGFNNPFSLYALVVNQSILRQVVTGSGLYSENISGASYTINHNIDGIMDFGNIASLKGNTSGLGSSVYLDSASSYIDFNSNDVAQRVKTEWSTSGIKTTYGAGTGAGTLDFTLTPGVINGVFDSGGGSTGELFLNPGAFRIDANGGGSSREYLEISGGNIIMGGFNNAGSQNLNLFGRAGLGFLMTTAPFSTTLPTIDEKLVVDGNIKSTGTLIQETSNAATDSSFLVTRDQVTGELQQTPNITSIATFSNTVSTSVLNLTRETFGDQLRITGDLTIAAGAPGAIRNDILNVIPQNFKNKKWFKFTRVTIVMEDAPGQGGHNGYLELNEVSTYQSGALLTDVTTLFIPGDSAGATRSYDVDGFNQTQGVNTGSMIDRIEDIALDNYIEASPKDLTLSGFSLSWISIDQAVADHGVTPNSGAHDYKVRFVIEGYLL